jgi:LMBR1 domain-containing protein 1
VVFVTSLFRAPQLDEQQLDEDAEEAEEEGLLASTGRRFGATWQDITGRVGRSQVNGAGSAGRGLRDETY